MSVIAGIRAVSCCACADFSCRKGQDIIAEPGPGFAAICINQVIETREIVAVINISLRVDSGSGICAGTDKEKVAASVPITD